MFIMMLGKRRDAQVNSWADFVIGETISWGGRLIMLIWGIVWISNVQVPYDYSEWLGPDWKV